MYKKKNPTITTIKNWNGLKASTLGNTFMQNCQCISTINPNIVSRTVKSFQYQGPGYNTFSDKMLGSDTTI